jgi:membrane protease YdiL (CAAX protease family)
VRGALRAWLGILTVAGVGGLVLGQQELALLVALAGVFVAAQAADLDDRWNDLYRVVSLGFVGLCTALLFSLAYVLPDLDVEPRALGPLRFFTIAGSVLMVATTARPVADALVLALFRERPSTHGLRLAARLTAFCFLLAVPGAFIAPSLLADPKTLSGLVDEASSSQSVLGYVLLAAASVGFLVRRDLRETLARLGIGRLASRDVTLIVLGVPALLLINAGGEWIQQRVFPDLWAMDQLASRAIASGLSQRGMLVVGLSAGIGEEITLRGALQPKLGLVTTSLLFAVLHVQYSWFGIAMIFGFGLILGTIRNRSNTTVAILVHALYDVVALVATT